MPGRPPEKSGSGGQPIPEREDRSLLPLRANRPISATTGPRRTTPAGASARSVWTSPAAARPAKGGDRAAVIPRSFRLPLPRDRAEARGHGRVLERVPRSHCEQVGAAEMRRRSLPVAARAIPAADGGLMSAFPAPFLAVTRRDMAQTARDRGLHDLQPGKSAAQHETLTAAPAPREIIPHKGQEAGRRAFPPGPPPRNRLPRRRALR